MKKLNYTNKRLFEIHLLGYQDSLWFEVYSLDSPFVVFQSDSIKEILDYLEVQLLEVV